MTDLARYTIVVKSPEVVDAGAEDQWLRTDDRVLADLPAVMEHVTEKIAEILPVGYSVEITEGSQ